MTQTTLRFGSSENRPYRVALAVTAALLLPIVVQAADYRLRWQPSSTPGVTSYRVYVRQTGTGTATPRNAGLPTVAGDGTMAYVATGLQAGIGYRFAVSAVASGGESALSNEIAVCGADIECIDDTTCTADLCVAGRCTNPPAANGISCADGNLCDGAETCQVGVCRDGTPLGCNDDNPCTSDDCSPASGTCTHALIAGCQACSSAATCSDGNLCNGSEVCQAGFCHPGTPLSCNDSNACTTDACSTQNGCVNNPITGCRTCTSAAACGDGNACNGAELCQGGVCRPGAAPNCADGNPCTADACEPTAGCTHETMDTCFSCASRAQAVLDARRVTVKRSVYGVLFRASGKLQLNAPLDPTETGLVLEIGQPSTGEIFYRAVIPGSALVRRPVGKVIRFDTRQEIPEAPGIRYLRIRVMSRGEMDVAIFGRANSMPASFPTELSWSVMLGDECGIDRCVAYARKSHCD